MTSVENMRFEKSFFFQNIYRSGFIDKRIPALFVNDEREVENKVKCLRKHTVKYHLKEYIF